MDYSPKEASKEIKEAIYLLFVKASTLPVFIKKGCFDSMQEGLAVINGLLVYPLDDSERLKVQRRFPSCKESLSVWVQLDVYCAEGGGIGIDEVDYIKHMIKEAKKENINLNGFRLTGCQFDDTQDRRGHFKMAPDGFERVFFISRLNLGRESA